ncbi:MAG: hypothetical protein J5563_00620 [Clostridia bacterium]|nr:hypothetical protein [Clostridia bacterium]
MKRAEKEKKEEAGSCETCQFYDWDEEIQDGVCGAYLDEDDLQRAVFSKTGCPMYRFFDEYKSVQKQN